MNAQKFDEQGIPFTYISPFNEPLEGWWFQVSNELLTAWCFQG